MGEEKAGRATLGIQQVPGKSDDYTFAHGEVDPVVRHAVAIGNANAGRFSPAASTEAIAEVLENKLTAVATGDVTLASRMLAAQAMSLDALITQMAHRAQVNMGEYPDAADRYMRLALKAQSQSRATLEALVKMHQPREQTVRHIHVGPDGQAVFIENLHGGLGNVRPAEQPYGQSAQLAALPSPDPLGNGVPVPGGAGAEAVPHPRRRERQRRA